MLDWLFNQLSAVLMPVAMITAVVTSLAIAISSLQVSRWREVVRPRYSMRALFLLTVLFALSYALFVTLGIVWAIVLPFLIVPVALLALAELCRISSSRGGAASSKYRHDEELVPPLDSLGNAS